MKTRMELWKDYRNEIEENIRLESAIKGSDEKLKILYERLMDVYPGFEKELRTEQRTSSLKLQEINQVKKYDSSNIHEILNIINESEKDYSSLASIDQLNFSSKELDSVIHEIKKGKVKNIKYFASDTTTDIELITKTVKLGVTNMKVNIAIDGPSGSGKSSAAKIVAKKYDLNYINSGLIYRAIALLAIDKGVTEFNAENLKPLLRPGVIELLPDEHVYLAGRDVTKAVRNDEVSQTASKVAAVPEVRSFALEIMQDVAKKKGIVMDGRDITFRVLPDADFKFYIDTKPEVRAKRRAKQNEELGFNTNYDEILKEIIERDYRDTHREVDPLQIVSDAIVIDSSNMTLDDVVERISQEITKK